jgi:hypothetical protein
MSEGNILKVAKVGIGVVALSAALFAGMPEFTSVTAGALRVTIDYKGAGKVDEIHKIWIWIFDNPAIDASSTPVASDSLSENGGTVSFDNLPEQVYIAVAFDEKGGYDGNAGPPPSGTPVAIYGQPGPATAIRTGADAKVTVTFDDSSRMP